MKFFSALVLCANDLSDVRSVGTKRMLRNSLAFSSTHFTRSSSLQFKDRTQSLRRAEC
jgi:hypothetical protein